MQIPLWKTTNLLPLIFSSMIYQKQNVPFWNTLIGRFPKGTFRKIFERWGTNSWQPVQCRTFRSGVSDTNPTKTSLSVAPVTCIFESYRHFCIKSHFLHFNRRDIRKLVVDFYSTKHWLTRNCFSASHCFNCTMCKIIRHQTSYLLLHSTLYIILAKTPPETKKRNI